MNSHVGRGLTLVIIVGLMGTNPAMADDLFFAAAGRQPYTSEREGHVVVRTALSLAGQ